MNILPKARSQNIVVQNLKSEVLIYDLNTNQAFCLNETSAKVYNACDGETSFNELKSKYQLTDDLIFFALDELQKKELLENENLYQSPFAGINRREVIRRIGLASMVALPVIAGIVAPQAISAVSGIQQANNTVCTTNSQCASGRCTTSSSPSGRRLCCAASTSSVGNPGEPDYNFGNTNDATCTNIIGPQYCCSGSARNVAGTGCLCNS